MPDDSERLVLLLEARIRDFERNMQKASGAADKSFNRMQKQSRSATQQMERDMARASSRINQALASTSSQIGALGRTFAGAFAGGVFAGGLSGIVRAVRSITSELSELGKVADKVGLSVEHLQQLRHVASLAGVEANNLDTAMQRFSRRVAQAANGSGELYEILKANNVQLRNADGTMRSQIDILRDYANLIKNAKSDQERLLLAFKAFDTEGAALVNLFRQGAAAIDTMAEKTEEAGGVIDEELVRRAEELDDKWAVLWRNFEISAKSAIMTAVDYLDDLQDKMGEIGNSSFFRWLADRMGAGDAVFVPGEGVYNPGSDELSPSARVAQAFTGEMVEADEALVEALRQRYGGAFSEATETIIPRSGGERGGRNAAARAALRQAEAVQRLISDLEFELSLIGKSEVEIAKANALRQAGAAATDEQKRKIVELVEQIHNEKAAIEQQQEAYRQLEQIGVNALNSLATAMADGKLEGRELIQILIQIVQQLLQMQNLGFGGSGGGLFGFLGSLFGGGPSTIFADDILAGRAVGLYADGTANTGGRRGEPRGIVHGQEAVIPLPSSGKVPVQIIGGPSPMQDPVITVRFVNEDGHEVGRAQVRGGDQSVDVALDRIMAEKIATPGSATSRAIEERYGLRNRVAMR